MPALRCPGSDLRNLRSCLRPCPGCGAEVELFSDEPWLRCPRCGALITNQELGGDCRQWCPAAETCRGAATEHNGDSQG